MKTIVDQQKTIGASDPAAFPLVATAQSQNPRTYWVWGDFTGVTAKIQISPDGTNWFDLVDGSFTQAGYVDVRDTRNPYVRLNLSAASTNGVSLGYT